MDEELKAIKAEAELYLEKYNYYCSQSDFIKALEYDMAYFEACKLIKELEEKE